MSFFIDKVNGNNTISRCYHHPPSWMRDKRESSILTSKISTYKLWGFVNYTKREFRKVARINANATFYDIYCLSSPSYVQCNCETRGETRRNGNYICLFANQLRLEYFCVFISGVSARKLCALLTSNALLVPPNPRPSSTMIYDRRPAYLLRSSKLITPPLRISNWEE